MTSTKMSWLLVGLLCLALLPVQAHAQQTSWEQHMRAGVTAYQQGKYAEAEQHWKAGLEAAEALGTQDPRYATSLNNLALLNKAQGRYTEAEPLYKRALAIREESMGPEHPDVATSLENYVTLLQETGRSAEATKMEDRVKAIRAKHAQDNPVE